MSGTSLDGLDIAYCRFKNQGQWSYEILQFKTVPYDAVFKERLRNAIALSSIFINELSLDFGVLMAQEVRQFMDENKVVSSILLPLTVIPFSTSPKKESPCK